MNIAQLKALIADLPDDMPVVIRPWTNRGLPIAGIHIRPYDARRRHIAEPGGEDKSTVPALVLNQY